MLLHLNSWRLLAFELGFGFVQLILRISIARHQAQGHLQLSYRQFVFAVFQMSQARGVVLLCRLLRQACAISEPMVDGYGPDTQEDHEEDND